MATGHERDFRRLAVVHGLSAAADAFFTVSLADSLFFNISVEAARPRLLLYLALTMAPFAIVAPFIGPFIGRVRGGQRTALVVTTVGRAALTFALVSDLRTLLMFPEAFGVLVLGKAYSIARNATVPRLIEDESRLVAANAFLARVSLIASFIGGSTAALLLNVNGASAALYTASVLLVLAGGVALGIPERPASRARESRLEYHELHAVRVTRALEAVGLLRASVGLLTFLFGFALKRSGAPVWHFGAVLIAGGLGAIAATWISARLRRHLDEERVLVLALAMPAAAALVGVLRFGIVSAVLVSAALGLAGSVGKHVFDALVQRTAPDADMARAFASFETRFQLAWIAGATLAVLAQADPRLGLLVICVALAAGAVTVDRALTASERFEVSPSVVATLSQIVHDDAPAHDTTAAVLDAADLLLQGGSTDGAVIVAVAALDAHRDLHGTGRAPGGHPVAVSEAQLSALRQSVIDGRVVTADEVKQAIAGARAALEAARAESP